MEELVEAVFLLEFWPLAKRSVVGKLVDEAVDGVPKYFDGGYLSIAMLLEVSFNRWWIVTKERCTNGGNGR